MTSALKIGLRLMTLIGKRKRRLGLSSGRRQISSLKSAMPSRVIGSLRSVWPGARRPPRLKSFKARRSIALLRPGNRSEATISPWLNFNVLVRVARLVGLGDSCGHHRGGPVAAGRGIIIRNPAMLEQIAACRTVIFDKTGTLTYGHPALTEVLFAPGESAITCCGFAPVWNSIPNTLFSGGHS